MFKTRFRFVDTSKLWQTIYPIFFSRPGRGRSLRGSWARWWGLLDWTPPMQILRFMLMFFILILIFFSMLIVIVCFVQRSWCWLCFLFWCWCISWLDTSDAKKVLNWYWIQVEGTRWLEFRKCQFNFFCSERNLANRPGAFKQHGPWTKWHNWLSRVSFHYCEVTNIIIITIAKWPKLVQPHISYTGRSKSLEATSNCERRSESLIRMAMASYLRQSFAMYVFEAEL